MIDIHLASRNAKKIHELERILGEVVPNLRVLGLDDVASYDEPVEDQPSFEGNALVKARAGFAATGLPTIADDSGICVDALNGMPGVLSARWSGLPKSDERNNALLLDQLADVPDDRRGAEFRCAIAYITAEGEQLFEGTMRGRVATAVSGSGGFGYDVLFLPDAVPDGRTSAELDPVEKDAISHRGAALRNLAAHLTG